MSTLLEHEAGILDAEAREAARGHPITIDEFLTEQAPFVERLRPIRNFYFPDDEADS